MRIYYNNFSPDCCCNYSELCSTTQRGTSGLQKEILSTIFCCSYKTLAFFPLLLISCTVFNLQKFRGCYRTENFFLWPLDAVILKVLFHSLYNVSKKKTNDIAENTGIQRLCMPNYHFRYVRFTYNKKLKWKFKRTVGLYHWQEIVLKYFIYY